MDVASEPAGSLTARPSAWWSSLPVLGVFSALAVMGSFLWQGNYGFSLWDEGFLWYGVTQTLAGEIPIRDFMAYDPGRYYWCAALMGPCGADGIISLRIAAAIFQALGIFVGLLLLTRFVPKGNLALIVLALVAMMAWSFPRHKIFDVSISIFLIFSVVIIIDKSDKKTHFISGFLVGFLAMFGKNHALYGLAGSVIAILYVSFRQRTLSETGILLMTWMMGAVVGYAPMLACFLCVSGFANSFWEGIGFLVQGRATNLPLPTPWPWLVRMDQVSLTAVIGDLFVGLFFIAILLFGILGLPLLFWTKSKGHHLPAVSIAAIALALPYAHYSYSRADVGHLALGIFPLLVGLFALFTSLSIRTAIVSALALSMASLVVMLPRQPGWQRLVDSDYQKTMIGEDQIFVDSYTASKIKSLRRLIERYAANGRPIVATPFWPGAYSLTSRKSPMWEIYALFPRSQAFQHAEIARIRSSNPGLVLILDFPLDGRDELRFRNTHPLISEYFNDNFIPFSDSDFGEEFRLYYSKDQEK